MVDGTAPVVAPPRRLAGIDAVRGLVMVAMALDHAREFASDAAFDPTDLAHTTPAYFLTRWITHLCAPTFVLLAGTSAFLAARRTAPPHAAGTLLRRGLWLMLLEVLVVGPLGWSFNLTYGFTRLQVIWAIGGSMLLLAAAIRLLSPPILFALGLAVLFGHDWLNANEALLGPLAPAWHLLDAFAIFRLPGGQVVASIYPVLPWFGIMATGYGLGPVFTWPERRRRRALLASGGGALVLFVLLRSTGIYGDPQPWAGSSDPLTTAMSFLNCTKYPPSLLYSLMTLGPALLLLAVADRAPAALRDRLAAFGRVPLLFYLLHLPLLHLLAVAAVWAGGGDVAWMFADPLTLHGPNSPAVANGVGLPGVYALWLAAVLLLYPVCVAYGRIKHGGRHRLLDYL